MKHYWYQNISVENIQEALNLELPGAVAHKKLLPPGRPLDLPDKKKNSCKKSAVLLFLINKNNELHLCFTRRNSTMKHHPGQISFPGGQFDENETAPVEVALRELEEETGVKRNNILVLGHLSDLYVAVSNFIIHPVVGYTNYLPDFNINFHEVDEIIIIPLSSFFESSNLSTAIRSTSIGILEVPCFKINGYEIWGATAMIISELLMLLTTYFQQEAQD